MAGKPYTRTGDIVIAVNPYQWFTELYTQSVRSLYADTLVWDRGQGDVRALLEPHVYEASSLAYRGLAIEGEDQSILVSGESGAGKTETVKILLSDLASVQRGCMNRPTQDSFQSPIVQRVLDSNPLLEAFGNAKTVRNDNSSRFGKYIQLQFDCEDPMMAAYAGKSVPSCVLAGSKCEVYLLEKSRVVSHEEDERTYHIFYQLLAAPQEIKAEIWSGLADTDNESYNYVGYTETDTIEGKTDAERFQLTVDSLALVGVKDDKVKTLLRTICIVLQLGNLTFEADETDETKTNITSTDEFQALSELIGIPAEGLTAALTIRTMRARNEEFKVPLNAVQARDSSDAFAKEIYAKTFLWLVRAINDATCAEHNYDGDNKSDFGVIGLLDIFGFESFETNRFEQLCINYANEKLQQKFTQDIFRSVQAEYEFEGIELGEITYDDNTDVLDLVEGRMGLLAFLNEECVRPGGSDKGFVSKVQSTNKDSPCFIRENHFDECDFGVQHYAGRVLYDATGFVTKNTDLLPTDLQECATRSTNAILADELSNESSMNEAPTTRAKKRPLKGHGGPKRKSSNLVGSTVWTKFKNQLTSLMTNLGTTRARYIRCIKPNTLKKPLVMQHVSTVEQLRCAGVVAAVTISRSAFPNRLEHAVVLERFKSLWRKGEYLTAMGELDCVNDPQAKYGVGSLLTTALKSLEDAKEESIVKAFVMGKTRAYFRAGALEYLEAERLKGLGTWAVEIQRLVRRFVARSRYKRMRKVAIKFESLVRFRIARSRFRRIRSATIVTQSWYRCIKARRTLADLNQNRKATMIQTRWRILVATTMLKRTCSAAVVAQTIVRGALQRTKYRAAVIEKSEEAKLENQVVMLQRKLEEAEARRVEAEKRAEEKARRAIEEYRDSAHNEEKKEASSPSHAAPATPSYTQVADAGQLSAQQQTLMDESGKMLEYLRKEVFKLRSQNAQMRTDFDLLKDNNQRLMDANASAGASFAALNQHAKQLTRNNEKLQADVTGYKQSNHKLGVVNVELREELKMKQATYVAEVHSRLQYQKSMTKVVDILQEKCHDTRLVEDVLSIADTCEDNYMQGPTGISSNKPGASLFASPIKSKTAGAADTSIIKSIRDFWS